MHPLLNEKIISRQSSDFFMVLKCYLASQICILSFRSSLVSMVMSLMQIIDEMSCITGTYNGVLQYRYCGIP